MKSKKATGYNSENSFFISTRRVVETFSDYVNMNLT